MGLLEGPKASKGDSLHGQPPMRNSHIIEISFLFGIQGAPGRLPGRLQRQFSCILFFPLSSGWFSLANFSFFLVLGKLRRIRILTLNVLLNGSAKTSQGLSGAFGEDLIICRFKGYVALSRSSGTFKSHGIYWL